MVVSTFKHILEPYKGNRTRHTCPNCGKAKQFTRYIDVETGLQLADHVGKCNRLNNCGHHYTPGQYFQENPTPGKVDSWRQSDAYKTTYTPPATYLLKSDLEATQRQYERNNFFRFLVKLFGSEKAYELAGMYYLGTSKRWQNDNGLSVVFWQIDKAGNIRQAKVMAYNPHTGRRIKDAEGKGQVEFKGKQLAGMDANLIQCFFGEHLLPQYPDKPVVIVESEKTAVIMAGYIPKIVWLAVGGVNGAKWTDEAVYSALEGRNVTLFPDLKAFHIWQENAKILATVCDVKVSDLLEQKARGNDFEEGFDIADYFIKNAGIFGADVHHPNKEDQTAGEQLPEGFSIVRLTGGCTLELDSLPFTWLNDQERNQAIQHIGASGQQKLMEAMNPVVGTLIDRLGFEIEK